MKIVFVGNQAWSMYNFRSGVIEALCQDGHSVHIIAPMDGAASRFEELGARFHALPLQPDGRNPFQDLLLLSRLFRIYRMLKPDLIFHFTIKPIVYGSLAAALARARSVAVATGLGYAFINRDIFTKVIRQLYRFALLFPVEVWVLNQSDYEWFTTCGYARKHQCRLLPGEGVDTDRFRPIKAKGRSGVRFLMVARALIDKGVGEYLQAAEMIRRDRADVEFKYLGSLTPKNPSGYPVSEFKKAVKAGIVHFLGFKEDVPAVMAEVDCVVLPSYREGLSRTLLEAGAMGLPLIASDVPGCQELVEDGVNGFLCKARDADSLEQAFRKFLSLSRDQRQAMGRKSRELIESRFSQKVIIEEYRQALQRLTTQLR